MEESIVGTRNGHAHCDQMETNTERKHRLSVSNSCSNTHRFQILHIQKKDTGGLRTDLVVGKEEEEEKVRLQWVKDWMKPRNHLGIIKDILND